MDAIVESKESSQFDAQPSSAFDGTCSYRTFIFNNITKCF